MEGEVAQGEGAKGEAGSGERGGEREQWEVKGTKRERDEEGMQLVKEGGCEGRGRGQRDEGNGEEQVVTTEASVVSRDVKCAHQESEMPPPSPLTSSSGVPSPTLVSMRGIWLLASARLFLAASIDLGEGWAI